MSEALFYKKYKPQPRVNVRKYEVLRESILAAIQDGYWQCGVKLPTELELSKTTPLALEQFKKPLAALLAKDFCSVSAALAHLLFLLKNVSVGPGSFAFLKKIVLSLCRCRPK